MDELTKIEEMLLIAIWRLNDEAYGYGIREYISRLIEKDFTYGNLYSGLSQLVKKGYVEKRTDGDGDQTRGRPRKFYCLTERGRQALRASRATWEALWDGISDSALERP
jgi:DNA-binding PadR family transcriptional regulator